MTYHLSLILSDDELSNFCLSNRLQLCFHLRVSGSENFHK